ncbi:MAG: hypothetical protein FVQ81_06045 [Candidatus Glassbacteria bacterium]|nr:hypothetical protein [Candidatus Glassbacteria bacterium]
MTEDCVAKDPEQLDRLLEVMHHFHCREPGELEELLELPAESLTGLFSGSAGGLSEEAERGLARAGVREQYIRDGSGSMLEDAIDVERLAVMARHAAHLLKVICRVREKLGAEGSGPLLPHLVTDGRRHPTALEEELINLLIEALNDPQTRERLLKFVRKEAENRYRSGPQPLL